jgi:hypothetical protein
VSFFPSHALAPAAALLFLLSATAAPAFAPDPEQPSEAVFYPDEARLTVVQNLEAEKLPSGATGFVLVLPADADSDSFMLRINGVPAQSVYLPDEQEAQILLAPHGQSAPAYAAALPDREPSPERRALLEKLVALEDERAPAEGRAAAADARLALLRKSFDVYGARAHNGAATAGETPRPRQSPRDRSGQNPSEFFSPSAEASALDADYAKRYPDVYAEREKQHRILADVAPRLEEARKALRDFDGRRKRALLYVAPFAADGQRHRLTYTYTLPASCKLRYTLDAAPDAGEVAVYQEATLTQNSGITWKDTDIYIAALRRDRMLIPPDLRPWEVATVDKAPAAPAPVALEEQPRPDLRRAVRPMQSNAAAVPAGPAQTEQSAFRLRHVGKQTLQHQTPLRVNPAPDILTAAFSYTLRPSVTNRAFLAAAFSLPGPLALPPAPARFSVDGVVVGHRSFSINSDKGTIFFGADPLVDVEMRNIARSGGEHGVFAKDETFTRHWLFTVRNLRKKAVDVVLEDPAPVSENEAVHITTQSSPQPELPVNPPEEGGAKVYVWKARLESGAELRIDHKVTARAPQDKNRILVPGR